ncbi:MAG TPA: glycosyltransferase family 4 protein [Opitutaceae bacterium]|nr:glycosyltransferase family 4 protein [Opitutaceae bacterium]
MKISLVTGFFLPVPPAAGGATEKTWHRLALEFAARGHEVTVFSRRWPGFPDEEMLSGVRHVRLAGRAHAPTLWRNLLHDFFWSRRVFRVLPPADIAIVNCVALPAWLGARRPAAGRVVLQAGRMPKGQFRFYRRIARILAPSTVVQQKITAENPRLAAVTRVVGYPIAWRELARPPAARAGDGPLTIGYVGRLHEEKGLDLLLAALRMLAAKKNPPAWRVVLCGPADVAHGGSGPAYAESLRRRLAEILPADRGAILPPAFDEDALKKIYHAIDVFCYPSLAGRGETFGVAVAEAMAAGAVPVVSHLACFTDFVTGGENGLIFDHAGGDAPARLAAALEKLLTDPALRARLAAAARRATERFDFSSFAGGLLADFATLAAGGG